MTPATKIDRNGAGTPEQPELTNGSPPEPAPEAQPPAPKPPPAPPQPPPERDPRAAREAVDSVLKEIARDYGDGAVMRLGEHPPAAVEVIPTGALALDAALGIGGVPCGRIVEVFGPEMSGKTTLVYHVIAEAQSRGGVCAFIDAEHSMDADYARAIGVDIEELLVCQPDYGEQALEIADRLVRSEGLDVVAVDSVAALIPKAELDGQISDEAIGLQPRMMSKAMRKLPGSLARANTLCLLTNQIRSKIGAGYGPAETQPGGRALKFYASQRLDMRRIETLKDGERAVGNRVRVRVVKNKLAPPFQEAEFDVDYGTGISGVGSILDLAVEHGVITKRGAHFTHGDKRIGHGRAKAKAHLEAHPELAAEIGVAVREALGLPGAPAA
jgi:recombination protein RecA